MKRNTKTTSWIIAAIILLLACIIIVHYLVNSPFEETRIYPDDSREHPKDTIFTVNGIALKMIGVKGGRIKCKGFRKAIELKDFYIGETEVTQELWMSVMGNNPSVHKDFQTVSGRFVTRNSAGFYSKFIYFLRVSHRVIFP